MFSCVYLHGDDESSITEEMNMLLGETQEGIRVMRLDMVELEKARSVSKSLSLFGEIQYRVAIRNVQSATPAQTKNLLKLIEEKRQALMLILCAPHVKYSKSLHKSLLRHTDVNVQAFRPKTGVFFQQWVTSELQRRHVNVSTDARQWICQQLDGMQSSVRQLLDHLVLYQNGESHVIDTPVVAALCGEEKSEEIRHYCHAVLRRSPQALVVLHHLLLQQGVVAIQISVWLQNALHSMLMYKQLRCKMSSAQAARQARIFTTDDKAVFAQQYQHWSDSQLQLALYELVELECLLKGHSTESDDILLQRTTVKLIQ